MRVIRNSRVIPCDVDDTLVLHNPKNPAACVYVDIVDPLNPTKRISLAVHRPMVRLLLEELQRGSFILVWSKGGHEWAQNVLNALNIDDSNIIVMDKPLVYFDDKPVEQWLKDRVYLEPGKKYKE